MDASDASNVERLIGSEGARVRDDEAGCAASSIERVLATVEAERRVPLWWAKRVVKGEATRVMMNLDLGWRFFMPATPDHACHVLRLGGAQSVSKIRQICGYAGEREVMFLIKSNFF